MTMPKDGPLALSRQQKGVKKDTPANPNFRQVTKLVQYLICDDETLQFFWILKI